jgi:hypothetical protein
MFLETYSLENLCASQLISVNLELCLSIRLYRLPVLAPATALLPGYARQYIRMLFAYPRSRKGASKSDVGGMKSKVTSMQKSFTYRQGLLGRIGPAS